MSDARRSVLQRLRATSVDVPPLPDLDEPWQHFADARAQFAQMVAAVGGRAIALPDRAALDRAVRDSDVYRDARVVCSTVPGVTEGTIELSRVEDPHELAQVSLAIVEGRLGVAENGAIWITDAALRHRAILFIAEHLIVILEGRRIVDTLHDAYARIALGPGFGLLLSGPSKTADIEQALVIGAHGARSLTVFVIG